MPQAIIDFDEREDERINYYSKKWKISKNRTVKRIVEEFEEVERGETNNASV